MESSAFQLLRATSLATLPKNIPTLSCVFPPSLLLFCSFRATPLHHGNRTRAVGLLFFRLLRSSSSFLPRRVARRKPHRYTPFGALLTLPPSETTQSDQTVGTCKRKFSFSTSVGTPSFLKFSTRFSTLQLRRLVAQRFLHDGETAPPFSKPAQVQQRRGIK